MADLEWEVEIFPDGRTEIFKGTIEQIVENLQKVNPDWKQDFNISATPEAAAASVNELLGDDGEWAVTKRADWTEFSVSCFGRWQPADGWHIYEGIEYLARLSGKPTNGPGPGNCGRVSCSFNSAIWWCNDVSVTFLVGYLVLGLTVSFDQAPQTKTLASFFSIASGAGAINRQCVRGNPLINPKVGGQAFHPTNWNVIVNGEWC